MKNKAQFIFFSTVLALLSLSRSAVGFDQTASFDQITENQIFDLHQKPPLDILLKEYHAGQILALGESHHEKYQGYEYFSALLERVGQDPLLKFIVLEIPSDMTPFFNALARNDLDKVLRESHVPSASVERWICAYPNLAYLISHVFPLLREQNARRSVKNPIEVRAVDGISLFQKDSIQTTAKTHVHQSLDTCSGSVTRDLDTWTAYWNSARRERDTAAHFHSEILTGLRNRKAIVYYHMAHLIKNYRACAFDTNDGENWRSNWSPVSWLGYTLETHPRLSIKIVVLDERAPQQPSGGLFFSQRQAKRYPEKTWGIETIHLKKLSSTAQGILNFTPESMVRLSNDGVVNASSRLSDMFDGLIWSALSVEEKTYPEPKTEFQFCH